MLSAWLASYPELHLIDLDIAPGEEERRAPQALVWLSRHLCPPDEKALLRALRLLEGGDLVNAGLLAAQASAAATLLPDLHLLAGAFHLYEGRFREGAEALRKCYPYGGGRSGRVGSSIRRVYPGLRFLLRICPSLILPLYPDAYAAGLLYAVSLRHGGQPGEALEVLREIGREQGLNDELKVLAAQIYLELAASAKPEQRRQMLERALSAAAAPEQSQRDALELARCYYHALASHGLGDLRPAIRELGSALGTIKQVNLHLHARARLLLAQLYAEAGLPLHALRQSALVEPSEVPRGVALQLSEMEEKWVAELSGLGHLQIEKLARNEAALLEGRLKLDEGQEEEQKPLLAAGKLDTSHDVLADLKPREMSWLKRKAEEEEIARVKTAVARGDTSSLVLEPHLTHQGRQMQARIEAAQKWLPSRLEALHAAGPRESLARATAGEVRHLGYDFNGAREAPGWLLAGERRMNLLWALLGAAFVIWVILSVLRSCVYFGR